MREGLTLRSCVAIFLLLAVIAICISPAVDLPETALRAQQALVLILSALLAVATCIASLLVPRAAVDRPSCARDELVPGLPWVESALPLLC